MKESNPKCPVGTIVLTQHLSVRPFPAWCNRWRCARCGPFKARALRKRLEQTHPTRLITLTLRPDPNMTPREHLELANRAWSILWRRLRRRFGNRAVGYAKVVELTAAGTPHLHILVECPFVSQRYLSASWRALTGSYIVDVRRVRETKGIRGYLTSYLTKALAVPPGMRKWSAARGYVPPTPDPDLEPGELPPAVTYRPISLMKTVAVYLAAGWTYDGDWLQPPAETAREPAYTPFLSRGKLVPLRPRPS